MSKLSEMIARLCPNGVEYKKLGEVAEIGTGSSNRNEAVEDGLYPFFVRSQTVERMNKFEFDEEAIIIPGEGGIGDIFHHVNGKYALHQRVYRIHFVTSSLDTRFAYYYLTAYFKKFILGKAVTATVTSIRKPMIENFSIPLPPLPVQREIVQILDNFANLTAELTAELAKRKKQYEHYRDMLLNFEGGRYDKFGNESCSANIEWKRLGEICDMVTDYTAAGSFADIAKNVAYKRELDFAQLVRTTDIKSHFTKEGKVFISESAYKYLWRVHLDKPSIVLPNIGNCGEVYFLTPDMLPYEKCALAPNALLLRSSNANLKFLYYWFTSGDFQKRLIKIVSPVGQGKFNKTELKQLLIPLPPLAEQKRIVAILDRFDALCNSLSEGLPAEIELRKKQYEYYRDKLLSFKEAG